MKIINCKELGVACNQEFHAHSFVHFLRKSSLKNNALRLRSKNEINR